jgi:hypothetical protein
LLLANLVTAGPRKADCETKTAIISHYCERFLQGNWHSFAATGQQELEVCMPA